MHLCCRVSPWSPSHSLPAHRRHLAHLGPSNCSVLHNGTSCRVSSPIAFSPFSSSSLSSSSTVDRQDDKFRWTCGGGAHLKIRCHPCPELRVRVNHTLASFDHRPSSANCLLTRRFVRLSSESVRACTVCISHCLLNLLVLSHFSVSSAPVDAFRTLVDHVTR